MKENLEISGNKLEIMSKMQPGVALYNFVLKEQRQAINDNVEETLKSYPKRLIKGKRGKYKDEQEGGRTLMITTTVAVKEVCVVGGDRARKRAEQRIGVREISDRQQLTGRRKSET